jgi:tetratricopeptide (TPR) repeat protein
MTDTQQPPPENVQELPEPNPPDGEEKQAKPIASQAKPVLSPPDSPEDTQKTDNRFMVLLVSVALAILLGIAAVMIWFPSIIDQEENVSSEPGHNLPEEPQHSSAEKHKPDQLRLPAEEILGNWLKIQAMAEAENIAAWGGDLYPAILNKAAAGDRLLLDNKLMEAERTFEQAINELQELLASKNELLASALAQGEAALRAQNIPAAARAFNLALAIDGNNKQARRGAERANNLDKVLLLYHSGLQLADKSDLAGAKNLLQQATELDNDFIPARTALAEIDSRMQELSFQAAMSRSLKNLEKKNLVAARHALDEAARLRPNDSSVIDIGLRLAAMEKAYKLTLLREKAAKSAAEERWSEVIRIYDKALAIDPQFGFAEQGRKQARQRHELDQTVQTILARPDRLQETGPLAEAEEVLAKIEGIAGPGPRLQRQRKELTELIRTASNPVEIILRSDNATSVVIYRVGRFGEFQEKRVVLRPGTYTVVGTRSGYRDVRITMKVKKTGTPTYIEIRCEEPI